ncbi:MAG TPA: hypothetical protein VGB97_00050 [Candidatus Paceibacterota bacterium]|jgi:hypothetical protein
MSRETALIGLGVLIALAPYLGLPLSILGIVLPVLGLIVAAVGATLRGRNGHALVPQHTVHEAPDA